MTALLAHWTTTVGIAGIAVVLATIANLFRDPDHNPETPPPKWVLVLLAITDLLSVVAPKGRVGIGQTRASIPLLPSRKAKAAKLADKLPPATALLPLVFFLMSCGAVGQALGIRLKECAVGAVPLVAAGLLGQAMQSLLGQPGARGWDDFAKTDLVAQGIEIGKCAAKGAVHNLTMLVPPGASPDPHVRAAIERGQIWLAAQGAAE
jgi:hypothetical protein